MAADAASAELERLVARALAEDVGEGDITSESVVAPEATARALILQKQPGVVFGLDAAREVFRQAGAAGFERLLEEGRRTDSVPVEVAAVAGPARAVLAGERTALNLLAHLSGIATLTARYVDAVGGTKAEILDTRKTTPGLRALEKQAVAAGGGRNHRMGLDDAILIKENHVALAGGLTRAVELARGAHPELELEVECRDAAEVAEALAAGADRLLLDNMTPEELRAAVAARDASRLCGHPRGVRWDHARERRRGRRDGGRDDLDRRAHPFRAGARPQPAARDGLTATARVWSQRGGAERRHRNACAGRRPARQPRGGVPRLLTGHPASDPVRRTRRPRDLRP